MKGVSSFDPKKGCQPLSTGMLGALVMLLLATAYGVFQANVLRKGGPQIPLSLPWMPELFQIKNVSRTFYALVLSFLITFEFMVTWQFLKRPVQKILTLFAALISVGLCFMIASGYPWFLNSETSTFLGWTWTRFEVALTLSFFILFCPWITEFGNIWHRQKTLSYPKPSKAFRSALIRWGSSLVLFSIFLLIFFQHPFYTNHFYAKWRLACAYLYTAFLILGLPYAFFTVYFRSGKFEDRSDPGLILFLIYKKLFGFIFKKRRSEFTQLFHNRRVRVVLLDLLVKVFFVPVMTSFLFSDADRYLSKLAMLYSATFGDGTWAKQFWSVLYGTTYQSIFVMDVSLALMGYLAASRWLGNKSRSVEPTVTGWMVAIMCYPPFNSVSSDYLPHGNRFGGHPFLDFTQYSWIPESWAHWMGTALDGTFQGIVLICFAIFAWSTMAFGLRFSNLTHRGIITRGPYAIVRHPAYIAKVVAWWCENLRRFSSPWQFIFLLGWSLVYYFRAITEERHLKQDPDYVTYTHHVKYKFIPKIW